ncbi:DUF6174 domain-containing protein [Streptomyces sp. NPDC013455]|uniref:DUF6174 domain-containing protein n=1 Tax=Streptomyces sp. NPDC013455 TaxID=3155605 RepID=UPI0034114BFF
MIAGPARARILPAAVLTGAVLCLTTACGNGGTPSAETAEGMAPKNGAVRSAPAWQEPPAYAYTLTSTSGILAGTFRIEVREGKVTKVAGLDEDSRRQARDVGDRVPTMGGLLEKLEQARGDHAEIAEATYAADGHPVRISLDWSRNAVDDEALYVVSAYEPAGAGRADSPAPGPRQ